LPEDVGKVVVFFQTPLFFIDFFHFLMPLTHRCSRCERNPTFAAGERGSAACLPGLPLRHRVRSRSHGGPDRHMWGWEVQQKGIKRAKFKGPRMTKNKPISLLYVCVCVCEREKIDHMFAHMDIMHTYDTSIRAHTDTHKCIE
jgi:hypothetical protein